MRLRFHFQTHNANNQHTPKDQSQNITDSSVLALTLIYAPSAGTDIDAHRGCQLLLLIVLCGNTFFHLNNNNNNNNNAIAVIVIFINIIVVIFNTCYYITK